MAEKDKTEDIRRDVGWLFSNYSSHEPPKDLATISEYFEYIAAKINYDELRVEVPTDLLGRFESICWLLRDRLTFYPDTIRSEVGQILEEAKLIRTFGILWILSQNAHNSIPSRRGNFIAVLVRNLITKLKRSKPELTSESLFNTKLAVNRLAQIVRYSSSIEFKDLETGAEELKDHYDPSLIEKAKLLALVNVLRIQLSHVPEDDVVTRILQQVERLETEIKKSKAHWGKIIAGFFILFSFVADVKEVFPGVYDAVYNTVTEIIQTLHRGGSVQYHRQPRLLLPPEDSPPTAPSSTGEEEDQRQDDY